MHIYTYIHSGTFPICFSIAFLRQAHGWATKFMQWHTDRKEDDSSKGEYTMPTQRRSSFNQKFLYNSIPSATKKGRKLNQRACNSIPTAKKKIHARVSIPTQRKRFVNSSLLIYSLTFHISHIYIYIYVYIYIYI